jgi:monovalent cation:H+ antiporter-2, CPA2 family
MCGGSRYRARWWACWRCRWPAPASLVLWQWPLGKAITFGLCICISSTVVVIRAFEQRNALDTGSGKLAVGWMIVEDLVMVLALVLLPALAPIMGGTAAGLASTMATPLWLVLGITLAKVIAFTALMYFVGRRTIPWLLWQVARTGSRELFTLSVLPRRWALPWEPPRCSASRSRSARSLPDS